jgi:hypothetical protein
MNATAPDRGTWRVWSLSTLAALTGALTVLTLVQHDWLESLGFDPDHGDGSAEIVIVAVLALACVASTYLARAEWRRARAA